MLNFEQEKLAEEIIRTFKDKGINGNLLQWDNRLFSPDIKSWDVKLKNKYSFIKEELMHQGIIVPYGNGEFYRLLKEDFISFEDERQKRDHEKIVKRLEFDKLSNEVYKLQREVEDYPKTKRNVVIANVIAAISAGIAAIALLKQC